MEIFFIIVFIASSIGFLLTPGGALGMLTVVTWIMSGAYLAFRFRKDIASLIHLIT